MKRLTVLVICSLAACSSVDSELADALEAERDFHAHQQYVQSMYDPEYVDDCLYYEDLVCEFE